MFYSTDYQSPFGSLTLAAHNDKLVGLWMQGQKYFTSTVTEALTEKANLSVFNTTKIWLDHYFAGKKPAITDLLLAPNGSEFRKIVWAVLCDIPYGELTTYGEIGKKVAQRMNKTSMAGQAIGGAVGHNPISIIIPCHRVIGTNGNLTGYAGGIEKKIKLLEFEGVEMEKLFVPTKGTAL